MARLLVIAILLVLGWRLLAGRWPWQPKVTARDRKLGDARQLLGVGPLASREDVQSAHRRLLASVHPDRGGSSAQVHEANAARDLLISHLPHDPKESA
jgi:preprotein translocase subunit Sec63